MTVKQLIEHLSALPQDAEIEWVDQYDGKPLGCSVDSDDFQLDESGKVLVEAPMGPHWGMHDRLHPTLTPKQG